MQDTFGIEEEFMLVEHDTLVPTPVAESAIAALVSASGEGAVTSEFLPSQIEYATEICRTPADAWRGVLGFRRLLGDWAEQHGVIALPSGTPFQTMREVPVLPGERYRKIARDVGHLTVEHLVNGMHVHVGISDREEGVRVLSGLRGWLPLLLALSGNSPFWAGADTTYHSWRSIQTRRWTTHGIPPELDDAAAYDLLEKRLTGIGATQEYSPANWSIRLSENYPTVEVRVCDTQLTPRATLAMALIVRALAHVCARWTSSSVSAPGPVLDSELWHAARYGVTRGVYNPKEDAHTEGTEALHALRGLIAEQLGAQDSTEIVDAFLRDVVAGATGAAQQRDAFRRGPQRLVELYRESLAAPWEEPPRGDPASHPHPPAEQQPRSDTPTIASEHRSAASWMPAD